MFGLASGLGGLLGGMQVNALQHRANLDIQQKLLEAGLMQHTPVDQLLNDLLGAGPTLHGLPAPRGWNCSYCDREEDKRPRNSCKGCGAPT